MTVERLLIDAIHEGDVEAAVAAAQAEDRWSEGERVRLKEASDACDRVRAAVAVEQERLLAELAQVSPSIKPRDGERPIPVAGFDVERSGLDAVAGHLEGIGYLRQAPTAAGPWRSYTTIRGTAMWTDPGRDVRVELHWRPPTRLPSRLRPGPADWDAVGLPEALAWAYPLVKVAGRARGRAQRELGPYIGTPRSLVGPLLDLADVTADDVVFDLGCGDGRIVIEAARSRGCRGVGVESEPALVATAEGAVADAGLADRVRIDHGDARTADLAEATVVVVFLPARAVAAILDDLLSALRPGARLIAHEQAPIEAERSPTRRDALFGDGGMTVAHLWVV